MFWIAGGDTLATAILKNIDSPQAKMMSEQFEHVDWAGFRFYDLIFPLFMFLVGSTSDLITWRVASKPTNTRLETKAIRDAVMTDPKIENGGAQ